MDSVLKLPFQVCFLLFKALAKICCSVEVTARHSFVANSFQPFKSDIDMTFFLESAEQELAMARLYRAGRRLFPYFGEYVRYNPRMISFLKQYPLNGYEIERDPALLARLGELNEAGLYFSNAYALTYLQAALLSDYKNLLHRPLSRVKKWRFHFDHVNRILKKNLELDENDIIISVLTSLMRLSYSPDLQSGMIERAKIAVMLDYHHAGHNTIDLKALAECEAYMWVYFPAVSASTGAVPPVLDERHIPIVMAQMDREILCILREPLKEAVAIGRLENLNQALQKMSVKNSGEALDLAILKVGLAILLFTAD